MPLNVRPHVAVVLSRLCLLQCLFQSASFVPPNNSSKRNNFPHCHGNGRNSADSGQARAGSLLPEAHICNPLANHFTGLITADPTHQGEVRQTHNKTFPY
ncbi:hypothetical protein Bbelb_139420 [Branchiostoma belcheri]|nr:hypothetical protein Bbelb_139420 [Branchiostoma belcheri]